MSKLKSASILMTTSNETTALVNTVKQVLSICDSSDICEIILITGDVSTPENLRTVEEICSWDSPVEIRHYRQKRPFVGRAFREGIDEAKGSHFIMMISDEEMEIPAVVRMLEEAKKHPDAVIKTSRWMEGAGFIGYNKIKLLCNRIFQGMMRILFRLKLTDITNCYLITPTELFRSLDFREEKHPFFLEAVLLPVKAKAEVIEIPAKWTCRSDGNSKLAWLRCFSYFKTAFRLRRDFYSD